MPENTQKMVCRRTQKRPELVERADKMPTIRGVAAVYYDQNDPGTEYRLWSDLVERIRPGAFDRAVREDDVRGLFNHNENQILGRTKAGTMRLSATPAGLLYEIDPPDTQAGRDVVESLRRGDVDGSSFMFVPNKITWEEQRQADGSILTVRWIDEVMLYDCGPVTFPAYEATEAGIRAKGCDDTIRAELEQWKGRAAADADILAITADDMAMQEAVSGK